MRCAEVAVIVIAFAGCNRPAPHEEPAPSASAFDVTAYARDHYPKCKAARICGDIAYVDCGAAVDGPAFYLQASDGSLISSCGGNCMSPMRSATGESEQAKMCRTLCPPPAWTCKP